MRETLESKLSCKSAAEWEDVLSAAGVPAGRIYPLPAILDHEHVAERGVLQWFEPTGAVNRRFAVTRTGFHLSGGIPDVELPPPALGEHTVEVLQQLGYGASEVESFRAEGSV